MGEGYDFSTWVTPIFVVDWGLVFGSDVWHLDGCLLGRMEFEGVWARLLIFCFVLWRGVLVMWPMSPKERTSANLNTYRQEHFTTRIQENNNSKSIHKVSFKMMFVLDNNWLTWHRKLHVMCLLSKLRLMCLRGRPELKSVYYVGRVN